MGTDHPLWDKVGLKILLWTDADTDRQSSYAATAYNNANSSQFLVVNSKNSKQAFRLRKFVAMHDNVGIFKRYFNKTTCYLSIVF